MCFIRVELRASRVLVAMLLPVHPKMLLAFSCHEGTLQARGQLLIHQDSEGLLCQIAFQPVGPWPILLCEIISLQGLKGNIEISLRFNAEILKHC